MSEPRVGLGAGLLHDIGGAGYIDADLFPTLAPSAVGNKSPVKKPV